MFATQGIFLQHFLQCLVMVFVVLFSNLITFLKKTNGIFVCNFRALAFCVSSPLRFQDLPAINSYGITWTFYWLFRKAFNTSPQVCLKFARTFHWWVGTMWRPTGLPRSLCVGGGCPSFILMLDSYFPLSFKQFRFKLFQFHSFYMS